MRVSRTVLRGALGETPEVYSPARPPNPEVVSSRKLRLPQQIAAEIVTFRLAASLKRQE
jgi:hypothetical protein